MALDFFKIIDGFEEEGETDQAAREKENYKHALLFARRRPNRVPDTARRAGRWFCPRDQL